MLRFLFVLILVVALVAGAGVYFVATNINQAVETAIEQYGPDYLGVPVAVESVQLSLLDGQGVVRGIVVSNPNGYDGPYALKVSELKVRLDPMSLLGDPIVIHELRLDGADIQAQQKGLRENNIQTILANLERAGSEAGNEEVSAEERRYIIDEFTFTNANAVLSTDLVAQKVDLSVPDIQVQGIGRDSNGATGDEVAEKIAEPVMAAVTTSIRDAVKNFGRNRIRDAISDKLGGEEGLLKGLFK